jgi:hypothetical protein
MEDAHITETEKSQTSEENVKMMLIVLFDVRGIVHREFTLFCALAGCNAHSIDDLDSSSDLLTLFLLSFGSRHE